MTGTTLFSSTLTNQNFSFFILLEAMQLKIPVLHEEVIIIANFIANDFCIVNHMDKTVI